MGHIDDVITKLWRHNWIVTLVEFVLEMTSFCIVLRLLSKSNSFPTKFSYFCYHFRSDGHFRFGKSHRSIPYRGIIRSEMLSGIRISDQINRQWRHNYVITRLKKFKKIFFVIFFLKKFLGGSLYFFEQSAQRIIFEVYNCQNHTCDTISDRLIPL